MPPGAKTLIPRWIQLVGLPLLLLFLWVVAGAVKHVLGVSLEEGDQPPPPVISPGLRRMVEALTPDEREWLLGELGKVSEPREDPDARDEAC